MQFEIFKYKSVTSTNDTVINLIKTQNKEMGCVYAEKQTKGRGTRGKKWISKDGNFFGSIFFHLKRNYPPFNEFSLINFILISRVIKKFCRGKNISIKWPNDIFLNEKKICGILQEIITFNGKKFLIIGIGINIISSPNIKNSYETTNILEETKNKINVKEILSMLTKSYENFFNELNEYSFANFKTQAESMTLNR